MAWFLSVVEWFADLLATPKWLRAVGTLAWPSVLAFALVMFRKDIRGLLQRLRNAKFPGGELNLSEQIAAVQSSLKVIDINRESNAGGVGGGGGGIMPTPPSGSPGTEDAGTRPGGEVGSAELAQQAASESPEVALMLIGAEIDAEVRRVAMDSGVVRRDALARPVTGLIKQLALDGQIPGDLAEALGRFWVVRNEIVHGASSAAGTARAAVDLGLEVYRIVSAIRLAPELPTEADIHRAVLGSLERLFPNGGIVLAHPAGVDFYVMDSTAGYWMVELVTFRSHVSEAKVRARYKALLDSSAEEADQSRVAIKPVLLIVLPDHLRNDELPRTLVKVVESPELRGIASPNNVIVLSGAEVAAGPDKLTQRLGTLLRVPVPPSPGASS